MHARKQTSNHRYNSLTKKNGQYYVVMLAGGPKDIAREIRGRLARTRGIYVKYHLEYYKKTGWHEPIPKDVDFIIQLRDLMGHSPEDLLWANAEKAGVRIISTVSKMSNMSAALYPYGITATQSLNINLIRSRWNHDPEFVKTAEAPKVAEGPSPVLEPMAFATHVHREAEKLASLEPATAPATEETPSVAFSAYAAGETIISPSIIDSLKQAASAVRQPSPELSAMASILFAFCKKEGVSVMVTPNDITISVS